MASFECEEQICIRTRGLRCGDSSQGLPWLLGTTESSVEHACLGAKSSLPKCFPGMQSLFCLLGPEGTSESPAPHFVSEKEKALLPENY